MGAKELKVGILTLAALFIAYFGFNYLKGNSLFNKGVTFYSIYQDVEGLHVGSKVVLNGYPIGKVKKITFMQGGSGRLIAEYVVTDESIYVSENTVAQILSTDLFGSKAINLLIGDSPDLALNSDTLASSQAAGIMSEINKRVEPYEVRMQNLLEVVDTLLRQVKVTVEHLDVILVNERSNIGEITTNLASITKNIDENNGHISGSLENIHSLTDSLSQADIKAILDNANLAVLSMKETIEKMNNGSGTVGKMMNDSSLYINLDKSAKDLDLLLKDIQDHPKRYVHFSIWGKNNKDKESKQSDN